MKYFLIPPGSYNVKVNVFISNNSPGDMKQFITLTIPLTEKPWGCICGYCEENNTLYYHEHDNVDEITRMKLEMYDSIKKII